MKRMKQSYISKEALYAYLFIAPFYLLFIVFQLYPLVWSFVLSFYDWNGLGPRKLVGLLNYRKILQDAMFWQSMGNTLLYLIANVLLILPLAVVLGHLLCSRELRLRKFFKTVAVLPYITSTAAAGIVFSMMFDARIGVINTLLSGAGLGPVPWLTSISLSKIPVVVLSVWRNTPWYMLIVMSAMLGVDAHLYEAAHIDGAGPLQRLMKITLPSVAPVLFFSLINLTIDSARIFTEPYILTKGGPASSSLSVVQYLYINGFQTFNLGYASTIGYMLTFVLVIVSIVYFDNLRRKSEV